MAKTITILSLLFLMAFGASAQQYDLAIGLRSGSYNNFTFKKSIDDFTMTEGIISLRPRGFMATGLLEYQKPFMETDALWWFYGFGGHLGVWEGSRSNASDVTRTAYGIGVDAIIGVEYNFPNIPFNVSLDCKPGLNLLSNYTRYSSGISFSVRYVM